jgi:hypothetical protein
VPLCTDHVRAYRLAVSELTRARRVGTAPLTESEEYDRLLARYYRGGKVPWFLRDGQP